MENIPSYLLNPKIFSSPTYQSYLGFNGVYGPTTAAGPRLNPYGFNAGTTAAGNTLNNLDELTDLAKSATKASNFANWMGGIGSGIGAIASIGSLWANIDAAIKQNTSADKMHNLARDQYNDEKGRYNKRQQERDAANQAIAESAKFYNPFARQ